MFHGIMTASCTTMTTAISTKIERSNRNLGYFNDDRIEFMSCLAPDDLCERFRNGRWRFFFHRELKFSRGFREERGYVIVDCHDAKGFLAGNGFTQHVLHALRKAKRQVRTWEVIFDWYNLGPNYIPQLYAASRVVREFRTLNDMSSATFATKDAIVRGKLMRLLGDKKEKPRSTIHTILDSYAKRCVSVLDVCKSGPLLVPLAYFRSAALPWEGLGHEVDLYFSELGESVSILPVHGVSRCACSAKHFQCIIDSETAPLPINDWDVVYVATYPNKDMISAAASRNRFLRALHYQQVMRVVRMENWPAEAPLWMAIVCMCYLRKMSEFHPGSPWLINTSLAYKLSRLRLLHGDEYMKMKNEIRHDFSKLIKYEGIFTGLNAKFVEEYDQVQSIIDARISSGEPLGASLVPKGLCSVCLRR